jgi:uncharacterized protein with HEPN domain
LPFRDPHRSLKDILDNIARIERFTGGMDFIAFCEYEQAIFAVQYALLAIGEAAHRLGDRAEILCPGQPWPDIRGIGNHLRHGYDNIDLRTVWNTAKVSLPPLKIAVRAALARE